MALVAPRKRRGDNRNIAERSTRDLPDHNDPHANVQHDPDARPCGEMEAVASRPDRSEPNNSSVFPRLDDLL
jgi:hypothetical protein